MNELHLECELMIELTYITNRIHGHIDDWEKASPETQRRVSTDDTELKVAIHSLANAAEKLETAVTGYKATAEELNAEA